MDGNALWQSTMGLDLRTAWVKEMTRCIRSPRTPHERALAMPVLFVDHLFRAAGWGVDSSRRPEKPLELMVAGLEEPERAKAGTSESFQLLLRSISGANSQWLSR